MTPAFSPPPRRPGRFADNGNRHDTSHRRDGIDSCLPFYPRIDVVSTTCQEMLIMLSYLLGLIQDFERAHGRVPVLVSLNARHMKYLMEECPDLIRNDEPFPFGFRISVVPEDELAHPVVSVLPVMRSADERSQLGMNDYLAGSPHRKTTASYSTRHACRQ